MQAAGRRIEAVRAGLLAAADMSGHGRPCPRTQGNAALLPLATSDGIYSIPTVVRSGFLRIVTNRRIFPVPTPLDKALQFLDSLLERENHIEMEPGERHWRLFAGLCRKIEAKGNDIPDAYLAALALEKGTELITADRGLARFPGLRWKHPLDGKD